MVSVSPKAGTDISLKYRTGKRPLM